MQMSPLSSPSSPLDPVVFARTSILELSREKLLLWLCPQSFRVLVSTMATSLFHEVETSTNHILSICTGFAESFVEITMLSSMFWHHILADRHPITRSSFLISGIISVVLPHSRPLDTALHQALSRYLKTRKSLSRCVICRPAFRQLKGL